MSKPLIMYALKNPKGEIYPRSISTTESGAWKLGPNLPSALRKAGWKAVRVKVEDIGD